MRPEAILAAYQPDSAPGGLTIVYPFDQAVFPPGIPAATFRWEDSSGESDVWLVHVEFADGAAGISAECREPRWTPSEEDWEAIQRHSRDSVAEVTVLGVRRARPTHILSSGRISLRTSADEIGAPIFYREVNLPFRDAVNDPTQIRWRFGDVCGAEPPRVILENLPVCGNCHSFSADGKLMGMDVDYANDRGSYAILPVGEQMSLDPTRIITWNDYKREDGVPTLGLLSQVSPDGKYVASTVKDGSVFVPRPDLAFSQLFFPIKGIVGIYCRETGTFQALPGADDPQFVQSNPVWSPDGKWIVFARSKRFKMTGNGLATTEECNEFLEHGKKFLFDLYRIPFNDGKGGKAEPLAGASLNGMSNYFPRYSPDGKWIVFCKAQTFMLLQPDSELYILPSEGGQPRRLACNTSRMNSWHSWSPNGRWLVFTSKAFTPYTQLFLTHIDEAGNSSPPVLLEHFTAAGRAANIPEFVHAHAGAIGKITEQYVNDHSFVRQAQTNVQFADLERAEGSCRKALSLNPKNAEAQCNLATVLAALGRIPEALEYYRAALKLNPELFEANFALAMRLMDRNRPAEAAEHLAAAVRVRPDHTEARYHFGLALQRQGKFEQALAQYQGVLEQAPDSAQALMQAAYIRGTCPLPAVRNFDAALKMGQRACELTQFNDPQALATLAQVYAHGGHRPEAVTTSRRAVEIARRNGREDVARRIERDFGEYWRQRPASPAK